MKKVEELKALYLSAWHSIFVEECYGTKDFQVLFHAEKELAKRGYKIRHEEEIFIEKER